MTASEPKNIGLRASRYARLVAKLLCPPAGARLAKLGRLPFRKAIVSVRFLGCESPPPPEAGSDGYTEITVASGPGPGQSEAEGMTVADVFTTHCQDLEVKYLFDNMGTFVAEQPFELSKGEARRVEGGSVWSPDDPREATLYEPRRDESMLCQQGGTSSIPRALCRLVPGRSGSRCLSAGFAL